MFRYRHILVPVIAVLLGLAIGVQMGAIDSFVEEGMPLTLGPSSHLVQGKLINIEGHFLTDENFTVLVDEIYVVKDGSDKIHRLKVDQEVIFDGEVHVGDEILAQLSEEGLVNFMRKAGGVKVSRSPPVLSSQTIAAPIDYSPVAKQWL